MSHSEEVDKEFRETLKQHNIPGPDPSLGSIVDLHWSAGSDGWYVELEGEKIYWFSGREGWKPCLQGYPWAVGRFK